MFTQTMVILAILTASHFAAPSAKTADPSRSELQRMLLNSQDLAEVTKARWLDGEIQVREAAGAAGEADSSGCPEMDTAVLAHNTGLTSSGAIQYATPAGDYLEQMVAFDRRAATDVAQLATAITHCPVMTFADGPKVGVQPMRLGEGTAGFRGMIGGVSRSVVLTAAHKDYVVELVASDRGQPDAYYKALLDRAFFRIDHG
jgi:hypothetical protein